MEKLSNEKISQVLFDTQSVLKSVVSERDQAISKLARIERRMEAEKLANQMHSKGLELDTDLSSLTDHLEKEADQGRLPVIKQAVDMVGPNMGFKTAHLNHDASGEGGSGSTDFERYLVGDVG